MADRFVASPCTVSISNNYDTCGTITRASMAHLTPSQLADLFKPGGSFADMTAWFQTSFEMAACGTRRNGLYDWLMSSAKNVGHLVNTEKVDRGPSLLFPFVLGRQDSVINKDYWAVTAGIANSAYTGDAAATAIGDMTNGPLTAAQKALGAAGDRIVRVVTRYGFDMDAAWFRSKDRLQVWGRAAGGQSTKSQFRVLAAAANTAGTYVDVLMVDENAGSTTPFTSAPTSGVLLRFANNVNDFESWCNNRPTQDPRKRVPFWYQTMRRTRCIDSEYKKIFARLMESNEYFRAFGDLSVAERNRQDEVDYQRTWVHTFFFGKAISANQTMALWQSLDQITTVTGSTVDPGLGGKLVAYRANMIGVYEQMRACDRVRDLNNNALNFYELLDELYNIYRARKSRGGNAQSIDIYTDTDTAGLFESAALAYYTAEYNDKIRITIEMGEHKELGFNWRTYEFKKPLGVKINVIVHEFFDDLVMAADAEGVDSAGRFMMILDMGKSGPGGGTIYPGLIASNRKVRTVGELENLAKIDPTFACTMEHITEEISLISSTETAIVECPANSLIIEGIDNIAMVTTGRTASITNLY